MVLGMVLFRADLIAIGQAQALIGIRLRPTVWDCCLNGKRLAISYSPMHTAGCKGILQLAEALPAYVVVCTNCQVNCKWHGVQQAWCNCAL